jgi:Cu(I)/Ag(I) efflux system membrane fusion protein
MVSSRGEYTLGIAAVVLASLLAWLTVDPLVQGTPLFGSVGADEAQEFHAGSYRLVIDTEPAIPVVGANRLRIGVRDSQVMNVTGARVRVVLEQPGDKGLQEFAVTEGDPGSYLAEVDLPAAGAWPLLVEIGGAPGGHADLTFRMATGIAGLTLVTATPEGVTRYTCPMHPSVSQAEVGQCPICGMELTPVKQAPEGVAHYTCPMHPSVKSTEPGQCPICGMDLTPVTHAEKAAGSVIVDQRRRQLIGLKTATVVRGDLQETLRLIGEVEYDPAAVTDIALPHDGKIGKLFVVYEGTEVRVGDPLFTVSSPDLYHAETDLVHILDEDADPEGAETEVARSRLLSLGLSEADVAELIEQRSPQAYRTIRSPVSGTLVTNDIRAGSVFWLGDTLMQIADPARIRIKASAYEGDVKHIREKMRATVMVPYVSAEELPGEVDYIRPLLQRRDHTADVYVHADWRGAPILANSYADVYLQLELRDQLLVPEQAVIYAGESRVVFVDEGDGKLQPRRIQTGRRNREFVQVVEGLKEGEQVVTSGNFLLASESKLKSGIDQW